ncbi:cyclic AMP-responsive element-binding protein 3-like protein 1 isoform 2-T2 [Syngnathus typhle]
MESILDTLTADKFYPPGGTNLLDLEELNDGDFLTNVPFSGDQMDDFSSELFSSFFEDHLLERPLLADRNSFLHMDIDSSPDIQVEHSYSLSEDSAPQSPALSVKMDQDSDDALQLPPTPPSSNHGDSDGSLPPSSPHLALPPSSPQPQQRPTGRGSGSSSSSTAISSSPLLTAPHKLQGSGPLLLTDEEKRTLVAEGYPVPNKLPLTKSEEKALKRVRRKIKNKISAQESRRKKKEYVECLEKKVENYTSENSDLWRKVDNLETANRTLLQQLQKLQSLISGKVVPRACKMASTQTGTCLMMMALCFVLVLGSFSPCLSPLSLVTHASSSPVHTSSPPSPQSEDLYTTTQVRSRSLLFFDEGSPLEETPTTLLVERLRSQKHIQTSRHTADVHKKQTKAPESDHRETKPNDSSGFF